MENPTEKFQNIWLYIMRLPESESLSKEEVLDIQNEKLYEAKKLIEYGADINEPFYEDREEEDEKYTPLYLIVSEYSYSRTEFMKNDFLDNMIYFLFDNDVVSDQESIKLCIYSENPKLLYEILQRSNDDFDFKIFNHIPYKPLILEIILGFKSFRLDEFISYEFSYCEQNDIHFEIYEYLPIEVLMLDYATERGSAITTDDKRRDIFNILKIQGSPLPSLERINMMFSLMSDKRTWISRMDKIQKRFEQIYEYFIQE